MRKSNKTKFISIITAFAVLLIACAGVGSAIAYFTTFVTAKGGQTVTIENSSKVKEKIEEFDKIIAVENTSNQPCYVRVIVIAGERFTLEYKETDNWSKDGEYWVYNDILEPGEITPDLLRVHIVYPEGQDTDFNVIVIEESVIVSLDENGEPYADWTKGTRRTEGGQQ